MNMKFVTRDHQQVEASPTVLSCLTMTLTLTRAGMEQDDIIIKAALSNHKMDVVRQLQEHIEFADNNNVGTPLPEENERTLPLTNKKGLAVLKTSRFGLTRNRAKTMDGEETKVDVLVPSSGNASSPAAQA